MSRRPSHRSAWRIFAWPIVISAASAAGLLIGLVGEGVRDALAWLLLCGGPLAVTLHLLAGRSRTERPIR
ncbi:hypothetical protein [Qipengyuania sediminis]|uniref:hypothetical protein n=1 Tax=Qipengyuania sediminis TaxID=1532023 RepID=UPI001059CF75|nr:hypothetical protein [Qipengyuania sediminis]